MLKYFLGRADFGKLYKTRSAIRWIITGPTKTRSKPLSPAKRSSNDEKSSSTPFDSSFTFQLFLLVGAMGAGYTLGKTTILTSPPATLFPEGSITTAKVLKDLEKEDKERENKQYDMFKRCALRILEQKGIEVDVKYGKNEALYNEDYCSKDIAEIMNAVDTMTDVFFGKNPEKWEGKSFTWYPQTTEDVSLILKNCQEFKIPVYTEYSRVRNEGLTFSIDLSKFKHSLSTYDRKEINCNIANEDLKLKYNVDDYLMKNLSATDLFFIGCGTKLPHSDNRLINNAFDTNMVDAIEVVLPDGNITTICNDENNSTYGLFQTLSKFQNELCIITKLKIEREKLEKYKGSHSLVVIGANSLEKLNKVLQEIRLDCKIALIDNNGCREISKRYGNYSTFAIFKIDDTESKLNKRFVNGDDIPNEIKIEKIPLCELNTQTQSGYLSDKENESKRVVLVKRDINESSLNTYYVSNPLEVEDKDEINTSLHRRIKLALDPARILNPGVGVSLRAKSSAQ